MRLYWDGHRTSEALKAALLIKQEDVTGPSGPPFNSFIEDRIASREASMTRASVALSRALRASFATTCAVRMAASTLPFPSRAIRSAMARWSIASAISYGPQPAAAIFSLGT